MKWSVEPGVFIEVWPVERLRARAEVRYGFNGYNGVVGNIGLDGVQQFGRFTVSLGPRLAFGGTDFTSAYFSVTPFEAALNGRVTPFRARGGSTSAGVLGALTYKWSEQWATTVYAGYDRLTGDAADSPITRRLGSQDQFKVGAKAVLLLCDHALLALKAKSSPSSQGHAALSRSPRSRLRLHSMKRNGLNSESDPRRRRRMPSASPQSRSCAAAAARKTPGRPPLRGSEPALRPRPAIVDPFPTILQRDRGAARGGAP